MTTYPFTEFNKRYSNDGVCLEELFQNRYGALPACPKCGVVSPKFYRIKKRKSYSCQDCGYQLSPTAGTIFHKSDTPLTKWFFAIYLFSQAKNGVSAKELERHLEVTYKCAWRIAKHIRLLMAEKGSLLTGTVEADETFVGGVRPVADGRGHKTPVLGLVERKGRAVAQVAPTASRRTAERFIEAHVALGAQLHTDESQIYKHVSRTRVHEAINHSKGEYARGEISTNTIEGFWSQLKRSLDGTYHCVSPKYLQGYVDYFSYHYNHRDEAVYPLLMLAAAKRV